MSRTSRLYDLLLRLCPRRLRRDYGDDMVAVLEEMERDARAAGRRFPRARVLGRVLLDLGIAIPRDLLTAPRRPGARRQALSPAAPWRTPMETRLQDVRVALRSLRRQPLFTMVAAVTVALGISATTTIFSVANGLLMRVPPGLREPAALVTVHRLGQDGSSFHSFSLPVYRHLAASAAGQLNLAAYDTFAGSALVHDEPRLVSGTVVSGNYFDVVGARTAVGRFFGPAEDEVPGRDVVAAISHRLWQRTFDGDPDIVGRELMLNGTSFTILGVAEPGFLGHISMFPSDVWLPATTQGLVRGLADLSEERAPAGQEIVARLADGATTTSAAAALDAAGSSISDARDEDWFGVDVLPYSPMFASVRGAAVAFLAALLAVAGVLLMITAVNVANMLLSRGIGRAREIGVRLALGASRARLVTQLLTESVALFVAGGVLGTLMTVWATGLLSRIELPVPIELRWDVAPDVGVFLISLAVAGLTGLVFGMSPALHATGADLVTALKEGAAPPRKTHRLRSALVVVQVAGSAILLVAAGLLVRSLGRAGTVDPGLEVDGVVAYALDTRAANRSDDETAEFFARVLESTRATPGVDSAGMISVPPLTLSNAQTVAVLPGLPPEPGIGLRRVEWARITPGYLATMRIPLVAGRDFGDADSGDSPRVVIVNEQFARMGWPDGDAIGQRFGVGSGDAPIDVEIVGVTRDFKVRSLSDPPRPMVFGAWTQSPGREMTLVARTSTSAAIVRDRINELDPVLPPVPPTAFREMVGLSLLPGRIGASVASAFGLAGLVLAAIGLYGLLAFAATQRAREIGVRMALGAEPGQVRALIVRDGLRLTGIGLAIGLVGAAGVGQLLRGLLFDLSPLDPLTFAAIGATLLAVAAAASWLPARRAASTDPVVALRAE